MVIGTIGDLLEAVLAVRVIFRLFLLRRLSRMTLLQGVMKASVGQSTRLSISYVCSITHAGMFFTHEEKSRMRNK